MQINIIPFLVNHATTKTTTIIILLAPGNFSKKNFCFIFIRKTSPGSEKKKSFYEKFAGRIITTIIIT
jgi:hypothetical protein